VLSVKHWYTGTIFQGRTSTYLLLVILVGVREYRTRNPWVSSRVFYHWAKSPNAIPTDRVTLLYPLFNFIWGNIINIPWNCMFFISCSFFANSSAFFSSSCKSWNTCNEIWMHINIYFLSIVLFHRTRFYNGMNNFYTSYSCTNTESWFQLFKIKIYQILDKQCQSDFSCELHKCQVKYQ